MAGDAEIVCSCKSLPRPTTGWRVWFICEAISWQAAATTAVVRANSSMAHVGDRNRPRKGSHHVLPELNLLRSTFPTLGSGSSSLFGMPDVLVVCNQQLVILVLMPASHQLPCVGRSKAKVVLA